MALVHGIDSTSKVIPLLLDASGNIIVSASQLTTTGGKIRIDSNGNTYAIPIHPHSTLLETGVTQILKDNVANNATVTVYTVTSGKTFYMTTLAFSLNNAGGAVAAETLFIQNTTPATIMTWTFVAAPNNCASISIAFPVPISIAAGYTIKIKSSVATTGVYGMITGYEK